MAYAEVAVGKCFLLQLLGAIALVHQCLFGLSPVSQVTWEMHDVAVGDGVFVLTMHVGPI